MKKSINKSKLYILAAATGVLLLIFGYLFWGVWKPIHFSLGQGKKIEAHMLSEARELCMLAITPRLHDSNSAKWSVFSDDFYGSWPAIFDEEAGTVQVRPQFRTKNVMGNMAHTRWSCKVAGDLTNLNVIHLSQM